MKAVVVSYFKSISINKLNLKNYSKQSHSDIIKKAFLLLEKHSNQMNRESGEHFEISIVVTSYHFFYLSAIGMRKKISDSNVSL